MRLKRACPMVPRRALCLNFARGYMGKRAISLGTSVVFSEKPGAGGAWICALSFVSGSPF